VYAEDRRCRIPMRLAAVAMRRGAVRLVGGAAPNDWADVACVFGAQKPDAQCGHSCGSRNCSSSSRHWKRGINQTLGPTWGINSVARERIEAARRSVDHYACRREINASSATQRFHDDADLIHFP